VQNAAKIDQGAAPKIRDQERTLAERLISELSGTEFHPEAYEDEYRKRLMKAIEQKGSRQEIERVEVEARPRRPTWSRRSRRALKERDRGPAKVAAPNKADQKTTPAKQPARRRRAS